MQRVTGARDRVTLRGSHWPTQEQQQRRSPPPNQREEVPRQQPGLPVSFAVEHLQTGRVIGAFEVRIVDPVRRVGEIGYSLARAYWGQGYNLEAGRLLLEYGFGDLRLLRIQALCDVANRRSYRTMEKLGMVRERVLSRSRLRKDGYVDCYLYGILWREWARRHALQDGFGKPQDGG